MHSAQPTLTSPSRGEGPKKCVNLVARCGRGTGPPRSAEAATSRPVFSVARRVRWCRLPVEHKFGGSVFGANPPRCSRVLNPEVVDFAVRFLKSPPTLWQNAPLPDSVEIAVGRALLTHPHQERESPDAKQYEDVSQHMAHIYSPQSTQRFFRLV